MYKLIRENVVKLTSDPDKRDRLITDGFELAPEVPAENTADEKPVKGKAGADGKSTGKA